VAPAMLEGPTVRQVDGQMEERQRRFNREFR
jgi:hypothetical protein